LKQRLKVRISLHDLQGLRDDLLRVHAMAHTIVNGADLAAQRGEVSFVDPVSNVIDEIDQHVAGLLAIRDVLQPLETLRPDDTVDFRDH
jgi:hypothetical protein